MVGDDFYEIAIIGGGISSCVFASTYIKHGFNGRIAIIETGRDLGGRSSTRNSLINKGWKLNHGAPSFNITNLSNNKLLKKFIQELLDSNIIESDSSDLNKLGEKSKLISQIYSSFYEGENYISKSSMSELNHKIISLNNIRNQIDHYFKTLIVGLEFKDTHWILTSSKGYKFKAKFLVCTSNLLLHKRSLNILEINHIPLRKAIPKNRDDKIDKIISLLKEQTYIPRLTFMIYTNANYIYKDNYKKRYRYFLLNKILEKKFKFERIVFQKQKNNKLGIVIHTRNIELINEYFESKNAQKFKNNLVLQFNKLFDEDPKINKIEDFQDISIMTWRASQPDGIGIPEYLQLCENYNVGFCGDWFAIEGFGRIEGSILSALKLSKKLIFQFDFFN